MSTDTPLWSLLQPPPPTYPELSPRESHRTMASRKHRTVKLEPGQHTIDLAEPYPFRGAIAITWRLGMSDGTTYEARTQGPNVGIARRRAKAKVETMLSTPGNAVWATTSRVADYMEEVTLVKIRAKRLDDDTTRRYEQGYRLLLGQCTQRNCTHTYSLAKLKIAHAMTSERLKNCLEEIGQLHGRSSAKAATTVVRKYMISEMKIHKLLTVSPLADVDVDHSEAKEPQVKRGGQALSLADYRRVIAYLLDLDPADVEQPTRGRWIGEVQVVQRRNLIELALAQMTTGLRTTELAMRPVDQCDVDDDGTFLFWIPDEDAKNDRGRPSPVMDPRVSARLTKRMKTAQGDYLFAAAEDPTKAWQPRTRDRHLAKLYVEISEKLKIPMFQIERGHSWRTTLNTLLYDALPEATRIRLLGHTAPVNRHHYTAVTSTKAVLDAAAVLREEPS